MAKIKQKGKAGAARAYVTRSAAVKKLQCSLADFRRLCILKGIFPREPKNRKKANKGSSAPTSFYYAKDIAYLAHEPVLKKLREHKAFAKKLARALGRGEWSSAKSLEENKPVYRLDHIIKERYPTFIDALRDIDDALCLVTLFSSLPSNQRIPSSLIENCSRLSSEWQLYIMHTRALRKAFLSIKGVYFQAEVMDQTITWLVPYQFTQNIPTDVDVRVMLTFLELYQTLLGFVFFKLYTDLGLSYPPPLDATKEASGAGVGAFSLQESDRTLQTTGSSRKEVEVNGKKISAKDVRQAIKNIDSTADLENEGMILAPRNDSEEDVDDHFVTHPSKTGNDDETSLATLETLSSLPTSTTTSLLSPYTFFLSRETSRPLFEFIIRSFGGRVGWPSSSGSGSPIEESDNSITHVIIDRPLPEISSLTPEARDLRRRRKYVQPQWIVDCINAGKVLPEEKYLQGQTLPPHLSPFGEDKGAYNPLQLQASDANGEAVDEDEEMEDENEEVSGVTEEEIEKSNEQAASETMDPERLRIAELEAESRGVDYGTFQKEVVKATRGKEKVLTGKGDSENDMNKMMMSRKQRKLYEKMKYGEQKRATERERLEKRRLELEKSKRKSSRS